MFRFFKRNYSTKQNITPSDSRESYLNIRINQFPEGRNYAKHKNHEICYSSIVECSMKAKMYDCAWSIFAENRDRIEFFQDVGPKFYNPDAFPGTNQKVKDHTFTFTSTYSLNKNKSWLKYVADKGGICMGSTTCIVYHFEILIESKTYPFYFGPGIEDYPGSGAIIVATGCSHVSFSNDEIIRYASYNGVVGISLKKSINLFNSPDHVCLGWFTRSVEDCAKICDILFEGDRFHKNIADRLNLLNKFKNANILVITEIDGHTKNKSVHDNFTSTIRLLKKTTFKNIEYNYFSKEIDFDSTHAEFDVMYRFRTYDFILAPGDFDLPEKNVKDNSIHTSRYLYPNKEYSDATKHLFRDQEYSSLCIPSDYIELEKQYIPIGMRIIVKNSGDDAEDLLNLLGMGALLESMLPKRFYPTFPGLKRFDELFE